MKRNFYLEPYKLSILQKSVLIPFYGISSILYPENTNLIASFGDVSTISLSPNVLKNIRNNMNQNENGKRLLQRKPFITEESINNLTLSSLDKNTFGYHYYKFMKTHDFSADARSHVRLIYII